MALSAFADQARRPTPARLAGVLGRGAAHWDALVEHAQEKHGPVEEVWNYGGAKWGWSFRLRQKKRNLLYLTPLEGRFLVGTALGGKPRDALLAGRLAAATRKLLEDAPHYAEGYGVRLEVRSQKDLASVKKILAAKVAR